MTAAARELLNPVSSSSRGAAPSRVRAPRRRAYRRGEFGKPKFIELDPTIAPATAESKFWERYAIPSGIAGFWIVFVFSNWDTLRALLG